MCQWVYEVLSKIFRTRAAICPKYFLAIFLRLPSPSLLLPIDISPSNFVIFLMCPGNHFSEDIQHQLCFLLDHLIHVKLIEFRLYFQFCGIEWSHKKLNQVKSVDGEEQSYCFWLEVTWWTGHIFMMQQTVFLFKIIGNC